MPMFERELPIITILRMFCVVLLAGVLGILIEEFFSLFG